MHMQPETLTLTFTHDSQPINSRCLTDSKVTMSVEGNSRHKIEVINAAISVPLLYSVADSASRSVKADHLLMQRGDLK